MPLNQVKNKDVGKYLDPEILDYMTNEQLVQLYELHKAASLEPDDDSGNKNYMSNNETHDRTKN